MPTFRLILEIVTAMIVAYSFDWCFKAVKGVISGELHPIYLLVLSAPIIFIVFIFVIIRYLDKTIDTQSDKKHQAMIDILNQANKQHEAMMQVLIQIRDGLEKDRQERKQRENYDG